MNAGKVVDLYVITHCICYSSGLQVSSVHVTCINIKLHTGKKGSQGRRSIEGCVIDSNKTVQRKHVNDILLVFFAKARNSILSH